MRRTAIGIAVAALLALLLGACGQRAAAPAGEEIRAGGGSYRRISVGQLAEQLADKDFVLVNTHIPYEGELPQTDDFIPYDQIERRLAELPADRQARIVLYCRSGRMSAIAAEQLVRAGYTNVWDVAGGMLAWEARR